MDMQSEVFDLPGKPNLAGLCSDKRQVSIACRHLIHNDFWEEGEKDSVFGR